ncbi:conserved exported hypothetical protein [Candidatus Sulfopaludibacter sp. SbA4]|nr:conserved exported hypothetical protein [Candidatus Sulfopaludibacter sp. SbA4]
MNTDKKPIRLSVFIRVHPWPLLLFLLAALPCAAQQIAIRMEAGAFRIEGWQPAAPPADGWPSLFQVFAGEGDVPAMLGSYSVDGGSLVFHPRFPVAPGMRVRAVFHPPESAPIEAVFEVPKAAAPAATTRVAHVYPSINVLPENQLKFYVYFSAPMSKGRAWQKIHLLDAAGALVVLPFLELDEELWDRDSTRLTVLFDPGRIKREVRPLKEIGPSIQAGKHYTLLIDRDWPDGRGAPLAQEFRKEFRVVPPDRTPPDTATWRIAAPRAGSAGPLVIQFPKPMDYALLQHLLEVAGPHGPVAGTIAVEREETEWRFTPREPWKDGDYRVTVQTTLEDLAGNHIGRAFDVDTFDPITKSLPRETVSLPFRTRH